MGVHLAQLTAHDGHHTVLYRVNAGGPAISGTPDWTVDTNATPSPYSNMGAASSSTYATTTPIDMTHRSIPAGTPASLFQTERFDRPAGQPMVWSFPVTPGSYEVRLYFAEIFVSSVGERVFGVAIEGETVLSNYDTVAEVGAFKRGVKSFTVLADSSLDVVFTGVVQPPPRRIPMSSAWHLPLWPSVTSQSVRATRCRSR